MQIHSIQPQNKNRKSKRVGRGGKRGTYSGRGIKGLGARAGGKFRPAEREILKKIPKLRGYRFRSFREKPAIVPMSRLDGAFKEGESVTPALLAQKGLIRKRKGRMPRIKILARGESKKKFVFKNVAVSKSVAGAPETGSGGKD